MNTEWKKCSSCKKSIHLSQKHYICSVSTCNGLRTGYVFCSMDCFESHLPGANHRSAGAVEKVAPSSMSADPTSSSNTSSTANNSSTAYGESAPARRIIPSQGSGKPTASAVTMPRETLVIASRLKEYITARGDMNTSASVMDVLSDYLRILTDRAIDNARADGRKTVLDRDFDFLKKS